MVCLVSDVVNSVINEMSMVPGTSTQTYATPRITQHVEDAYVMLIDQQFWPELMDWYQPVTPDGVTGIITSDLVSPKKNHEITRFQDLEFVFPQESNRPLKILPPRFNPQTLAGSNSVYVDPDSTNTLRPFKVWPLTAADILVIRARSYPILPISSTDTVYLDKLLLTYMACWFYASDDGTNPGQIEKFQTLFEKRLTQVTASWNQAAVQLDPRFPTTEYEWTERE